MNLRRRLGCIAGCFFLGTQVLQAQQSPGLTVSDVQQIIAQAVSHASRISPNSVVAVLDREGFVLGVWSVNGTGGGANVPAAIAKAGTAAFLSSNDNAFSSRTAGFIIQDNFPPGVVNRPPGPLVGVGLSNLPFSDVNRFKGPGGAPVPGTSLSGSPGGMPLFKGGRAVGGVGVAGDGTEGFIRGADRDEEVAVAGQTGFEPNPQIIASNVFIDGIGLAYSASRNGLSGVRPLGSVGQVVQPYTLRGSEPVRFPVRTFGGVEGELRFPIKRDPLPGSIDGRKRLTAKEVTGIIEKAARRAKTTRAGIRVPPGKRTDVWISVVNNPNRNGVAPEILGVFRIGDATIFSFDVAVQKARTAVFFSSKDLAQSTRTVGFLAQRRFPPGIASTQPGPYFGLQGRFSGAPINPNLPNGITIFPGGFPLYRGDALVGAIGVSGDGVDQDDIVAASGTEDFLPPDEIRADRFLIDGARLPYAKFPRNPEL